ncbi:MAG TPA: SDR family oxidoreductase [Chloroflexota bacterium]|nr:SDR family oxidoreductase [Chloroflexota bacterium]
MNQRNAVFQPDLLQGKVILITGGGTGLGRSMGERFLELGARLAIAGRREDVLRAAAAEMGAGGHEVLPVPCDVRDPERVARMIDTVWTQLGTIDVLVNNAAGNFISPTERLSHRAVDAVLNIVLHGTFYCTLEVGKRLISAGRGGVMLNIVTTYASSGAGSGYVVPSAAAKAGVLALTRSLAVEWAHHGIRQVAIAPGPFPTPGAWERLIPTTEIEVAMTGRVPLGRVGEHQELANLASFLISDYAGYINGEVITIDGGEWLQGAGEFNFLRSLSAEEWDAVARRARGG